jgi:hypothetical protein
MRRITSMSLAFGPVLIAAAPNLNTELASISIARRYGACSFGVRGGQLDSTRL